MGVLVQSFQVQMALPVDLFGRLQRVRRRYATALAAAGQGDFSQGEQLRVASRLVGRLLAEEARKAPEERGGLRMLDISLAVDRFFPELRAWTQREVAQRQRERMGDRAS